jgi:hypothetical protein
MADGWLFMSGAAIAILLAIAAHVALHCPISPLPLYTPSSSLSSSSNNLLQVCFLFPELMAIFNENNTVQLDTEGLSPYNLVLFFFIVRCIVEFGI